MIAPAIVRRRLALALVLLLVLAPAGLAAAPPAAGQPAIAITDLGILPGGYASVARAINNHGLIVGDSYDSSLVSLRPFLWRSGGMTPLIPSFDQFSSIYDINDLDQAVGYSYSDGAYPFVWQAGTMTYLARPIPPPPAVPDARAYAVNDLGWVVGEGSFPPAGAQAMLWRADDMINLTQGQGLDWSRATDVNNQGQIVGNTSMASVNRPFLWQNSAVSLGEAGTEYHAINEAGTIVGNVWYSGLHYRAALWRDSARVDLGALPGDLDSIAYAINEQGWVVGASFLDADDDELQARPFLWRDGTMIELPTLAGSQGRALGINDSGQIVGVSFDAAHNAHAVRWTVAPPAAPDDVFVSELGAGAVLRVDSAGVTTIYADSLGRPGALKFDQHGDLFVLDGSVPQVLEIDRSGAIATYTTNLPEGNPVDLLITGDDAVLLLVIGREPTMGEATAEIWQLARGGPARLLATTALAAPFGQSARGFTCGPDGALYLAMQGGSAAGRVMRVTRAGDVATSFDPQWAPSASGAGSLLDLRFDSVGDLLLLGRVASGDARVVWKLHDGTLTPLTTAGQLSSGALQLAIDPADTLYVVGGGFGGGSPDGAVQRVSAAGGVATLATFPSLGPIPDADDLGFDACPPAAPPTETTSQAIGAGQSLSTDSEHDGATPADPIETTATSPVAGTLSIVESEGASVPPSGYTLLGHQVVVTAPIASAAAPLTLQFRLDASRIDAAADLDLVTAVRDGVPAADCSGSGTANPDPCIALRQRLPDGDVQVTALTSHASTWQLAAVTALDMRGFYQPVDMSTPATRVWNTVKNGATVPLKFEVFAGVTELGRVDVIKQPLTATRVDCTSGAEDGIEQLVPAGGTTLRYDASEGRFVYNWKTPKTPGACYSATIQLKGGASRTAYFRMK